MPWTTTGFEFPINPTTRKHYRGGNVLTFAAEAIGKGFTSGEWATSSNRPRSVVRFVRSNTAPRVSGGASPPPRRPTRRPAVVTTVMVDECTPANRRCHRAFACPRQRASGRSRTANDGPAFRRVAAGCGGLRRVAARKSTLTRSPSRYSGLNNTRPLSSLQGTDPEECLHGSLRHSSLETRMPYQRSSRPHQDANSTLQDKRCGGWSAAIDAARSRRRYMAHGRLAPVVQVCAAARSYVRPSRSTMTIQTAQQGGPLPRAPLVSFTSTLRSTRREGSRAQPRRERGEAEPRDLPHHTPLTRSPRRCIAACRHDHQQHTAFRLRRREAF